MNPMEVPGLSGYLARRQQLQQESAGELSQLGQAANLAGILSQKKDEDAIKQVVTSGAPPEQVVTALMQLGPKGAAAAHQYASAMKEVQTAKATESLRGLTKDQLQDPDKLDQLGASGLPGTAHFTAAADRIRKKQQNDATIASMRRQPGADGKDSGGLFGSLMESEVPAIANQAKTLQSQLEVPNHSIPAQHFMDMQKSLAAQESGLLENRRKEGVKKADQSAAALAPDAIDQAAERYNLDGTLPSNLGRGTQGAMNTAAILNKASAKAMAAGDSGEAARIRQVANKASSSALAQLSQQEAKVGAFERNFMRNADLALEQSTKVDRMGSPAIDRWINAGKKNVAGDPGVATLAVAMKAVINEYAKIISGSMGNTATAEGEIKKVENLLSSASSPEQVKSVIAFMKLETSNRMKGFAEQKAELIGGMRGKPPVQATPSASPQPAAATAPAQGIQEGQTATGPNGAKIVFKGGQWQPIQ